MHRILRKSSVAALAAAVVVSGSLAVASAGSAVGANDPTKPVSAPVRFVLADGEDPGDYWTRWRMANAKPMSVERGRKQPRVDKNAESGQRARIDLGTDVFDEPPVVQAAEEQPPANYPFPFNRRTLERPLRRMPPYRQVGRIFFRRNGSNFSCSGASVTGGSRHIVLTAGHCLHDGSGSWSKNVVFVPGRQPGKNKNPYGKFVARELWVPSGWANEQRWAFDVGAFSVGKNQKGKSLRKAVGAMGFAYNEGRVQPFDAFGFPVKAKQWSGNVIITCSSAHMYDDANGEDPSSIGIGCDMTGGSSGGPWIVALRRRNLINGVTSYGYASMPGAVHSPYFDGTANKVRCAAGTGNPDAAGC